MIARWLGSLSAAAYLGIAFVFIYLPVFVLVLFSFQAGNLPVPPFDGPSLRWYQQMLGNERLMSALWSSIWVALSSATVSTVLGFLAAYGLFRRRTRAHGAVRFLLMAPITVSYLIIGMGLLIALNLAGIPRSLLAVAAGHAVINLPLCFAIIYSQFGGHLKHLDAAARDLGAGDAQTLLRVIAPAMKPTLFAAFCLAATLSWDEFIIALLLSRFDVTLPVIIFEMLRAGLTPEVNAAGTVVFAISMSTVGIAATVMFMSRKQDD